MIYLDNGATSLHKPATVVSAVRCALENCANPGRGGYQASMTAAKTVLRCRETAARLFDCSPEQVAFTANCTHGLNMAIRTIVKPGSRVVVTGFEHNAVVRPLHELKADIRIAARKLFDRADTLASWEDALRRGADAAVFTHCSNVFGYILPVEEMAALCQKYKVPFVIDAAQSAGVLPISLTRLGADFIAMPGHKGLLGPQGTGILLCNRLPKPLLQGGTGSNSASRQMPDFLPDIAEAGTLNVPGIAGLQAGMAYVEKQGVQNILEKERTQARRCVQGLENMGLRVFYGEDQCGTVSFVPEKDCEETAAYLARNHIAVRSGLHCAPLAHESAGTLRTGTVRISFGHDATAHQTGVLLLTLEKYVRKT